MAKSSSKVISGTTVGQATQWRPPAVAGEVALRGRELEAMVPPTVAEMEAIRQQAYEEGFDQGRKDGESKGYAKALEAGRANIAALCDRFGELMQTLHQPLKHLDDEVEQEILTLVIAMTKQLVRREVQSNPEQIVGVVREALGILPVGARGIRLILNPKDAELVKEIYRLSDTEVGWNIVEDPLMQVGGCTVETETSAVDATLETRLTKLIAPLLGGRRSEEGQGA